MTYKINDIGNFAKVGVSKSNVSKLNRPNNVRENHHRNSYILHGAHNVVQFDQIKKEPVMNYNETIRNGLKGSGGKVMEMPNVKVCEKSTFAYDDGTTVTTEYGMLDGKKIKLREIVVGYNGQKYQTYYDKDGNIIGSELVGVGQTGEMNKLGKMLGEGINVGKKINETIKEVGKITGLEKPDNGIWHGGDVINLPDGKVYERSTVISDNGTSVTTEYSIIDGKKIKLHDIITDNNGQVFHVVYDKYGNVVSSGPGEIGSTGPIGIGLMEANGIGSTGLNEIGPTETNGIGSTGPIGIGLMEASGIGSTGLNEIGPTAQAK